jgi:hypothetical protein
MHLVRRAFVLLVTVSVSASILRAESGAAGPRLLLERVGGTTTIAVEVAGPAGTVERRVLRSTAAEVAAGPTGADPTGSALFARWTENGAAWTSWSRDAGATWSEARPLPAEIRLVAGSVEPGRPMPPVPPGLALPADGEIFVVQLRSMSLPEFRAALRSAGAEVLQFVPHRAHIVRIPAGAASRIAALDFVERVEPFHPAYRLEPALRGWLGGSTLEAAVRDAAGRVRLNVMSFGWGETSKQRLAAAARSFGADVALWTPSGHILEMWVPRDGLAALAAHPDVAWIDRWSAPEVDMDQGRVDAGADWLEADSGLCGATGVRGEVMDNGVQQTHPDFDGILMHTTASTDSHGTSTFGIVFGNGARDGDGQAKGTGFLPCAGKQGIFADYDQVSDRFAHTQELKGPPYFAAFQSNSWGSATTTAYTSVSSQMDDIIFRLDIAITQSQSNTGNRNSRPQAWAKNIISVGAIRHYDTLDESDDRWGGGASIGPADDGRLKPDVHYWYDDIYTTTTNSGYTSTFGGTSGATPMVAGVLGLMAEMWADNAWGTDPIGSTVFDRLPHHTTLKALLVNNARQYAFSGTDVDLSRYKQGWGKPNARIAKERAPRSLVVDWDVPLSVGQRATYDLRVAEDEAELKITMIYPDPPGTTSATLHRINDVNLRVTSPGGAVYHGNVGLEAGNVSTPGGAPNAVDTVENVFVKDPEPGLWRVEVEAAEVNQDGYLDTAADDVVFSLVATGVSRGVCGNGVREPGEGCDGADVGGLTCVDLGCDLGGTLACAANCTLDASACSSCPACGDGVCDPRENCESCPSDCISDSTAVCGNGVCEIGNGEDCESCSADCNGVQNGNPTQRFCCGDGAGQNPVGCADSRCTASGNTCRATPVRNYCCGDFVCQGAETEASCSLDCGDPGPGEAGTASSGGWMMLDYDRAADVITVNFGPGCSSPDHDLAWGELTPAGLASYAWAGRECAVGSAGSYAWPQDGLPPSTFFVVVGTNGDREGSYGRDSARSERPEDATPAVCQVPRILYRRCD